MHGSHSHHQYNHFHHTQNAWNQQLSLSHLDHLKECEQLLLLEMAVEERHLKRSLPLRDVFLALLSPKYRHEMMRAKMQRRERLERLQAQLAVLRDKLALSSSCSSSFSLSLLYLQQKEVR